MIKRIPTMTDGIKHTDLVTLTPPPEESTVEHRERLKAQRVGSTDGIHPKVVAAQETFERLRKQRERRNKS